MSSICLQTRISRVADGKEDAMRSIQEIVFSLMIVVGLSMIVYDVINARSVARAVEQKNLLKRNRQLVIHALNELSEFTQP
jgi:hypothetical protein